MIDCSSKASEQHRTCGSCEELYTAYRCKRFGHVMLDGNDEPNDDEMTFADCCALWKPRTELTIEQRCQQLEQVAKRLYRYVKKDADESWSPVKEKVARNFREELKAIGVSLDEQ